MELPSTSKYTLLVGWQSVVQVCCSEGKFNDRWWRLIEIAEAKPPRPDTKIGQAWPMLPVASIGKPDEIEFLQSLEVRSTGLVGDAFVLHGALITVHHPANDQRTPSIPTQIDHFARGIEGVEDDLKVVRYDEADDRNLWSLTRRNRCLNRQ